MELQFPTRCAICRLVIREEDLQTERAPVFLVGKQVTAAHTHHFFDDAGLPGPAYEQNLTLLALAHGKREGWLLPDYSPGELRKPREAHS